MCTNVTHVSLVVVDTLKSDNFAVISTKNFPPGS